MDIQKVSDEFLKLSIESKYSYNFKWLDRPIIQYPQDIVAFQEIVSSIKPDLIIETGIAHGGSLILSASLLCILDLLEGKDPRESKRSVIGIDIDIRKHNKEEILKHPLSYKIKLIEGSSIDQNIIKEVKNISKKFNKVLVALDSNHSHRHVLSELEAYANLVSKHSYCIVFDTIIENLPKNSFPDRNWEVGNNSMTAVKEWLNSNPNFKIDKEIDKKLLISCAPNGYLKRLN
tara:strand:+ start:1948 stop:2646 length:699 start_codon:yes stop_codon:yes gene_type:complete